MTDKEYLKRCFMFDPEIITCRNCNYNYKVLPSAQEGTMHGEWCQALSFQVCGDNNEECIREDNARALSCKHWFPREFNRSNTSCEIKPEARHYEKDSMG